MGNFPISEMAQVGGSIDNLLFYLPRGLEFESLELNSLCLPQVLSKAVCSGVSFPFASPSHLGFTIVLFYSYSKHIQRRTHSLPWF